MDTPLRHPTLACPMATYHCQRGGESQRIPKVSDDGRMSYEEITEKHLQDWVASCLTGSNSCDRYGRVAQGRDEWASSLGTRGDVRRVGLGSGPGAKVDKQLPRYGR